MALAPGDPISTVGALTTLRGQAIKTVLRAPDDSR